MDNKPGHVYQIGKLVEGNYKVWHIQMSAILIVLDLWNIVCLALESPTKDMMWKGSRGVQMQQKKREMVRSKIIMAINPSQVPFMMGIENPLEIWEALENMHCSLSVTSALSLCCSFLHMVKNVNKSTIGWISHVCA